MLLLSFLLQPDDVTVRSCQLDGLLNSFSNWSVHPRSFDQGMGAGASTGPRPSPITAIPLSRNMSPVSTSVPLLEAPVESDDGVPEVDHIGPPTPTCCHHYKANHSHSAEPIGLSTPVLRQRENSVDEEIEEIVANTLDIEQSFSHKPVERRKNTLQNGSANGAMSEFRNSEQFTMDSSEHSGLESEGTRAETLQELHGSLKEVDYAKFKKVNHKACTVQRNGRILHQQDSDLLWRLGLISPETYTPNNKTRSAPSAHGHTLKPPSYDLTEEQLMANIEKEFAELTGTVN